MFDSSLVNGSLKGKDWPFDEQFDNIHELANHGLFHANQVSFTVVVLDEAWDGLEGPDTQKWLRRWVPLRTILHEVPFFSKVEGSLAEVQADWEDLKEMLSPIEAVFRYNRLFTWPSAKSTGGFLFLNDINSRNLLLPSSSKAFPALFG